jgi:hypothetical protein
MALRSATGMHHDSLARLFGAVRTYEYSRKFSAEDREQYERSGDAMAGGRFPIRTQDDLNDAVDDYYRTGRPSAVAAHIHAMAKKHKLTLPSEFADS